MVGRSTNCKRWSGTVTTTEELFEYGRKPLKEAQTIAQLRHPHLVRVLNYFELNETAYLVMDYSARRGFVQTPENRRGATGIQMPGTPAVKLPPPVRKACTAYCGRSGCPGCAGAEGLYLTKDDELIILVPDQRGR